MPLRDRIALRVKSLQQAAPGAAADLKARVRAGVSASGLDRINRETLKAGRDGLAAKVEAMIKPRPADEGEPAVPPQPRAPVADPPRPAAPLAPATAADITSLKAKLDAALRPPPETPRTDKPDTDRKSVV